MTLGDLLVHLRARAGGVFYSDVAEATGIPVLRIVRAERTTSVPDLSDAELARLADYFGVPIEELQQAKRQTRAEVTAYLGGQEKAHAAARGWSAGRSSGATAMLWRCVSREGRSSWSTGRASNDGDERGHTARLRRCRTGDGEARRTERGRGMPRPLLRMFRRSISRSGARHHEASAGCIRAPEIRPKACRRRL